MTAKIPALTATQMRDVDRIAEEGFHLGLLQMTENAGRNLAELALRRFAPARCLVLAGNGGNGAGGLAAARHLLNRGAGVHVVLATNADDLAPAAAKQLEILHHMGAPVDSEPSSADLVIDALIGYGLIGAPHGRAAELIRWTEVPGSPVLALDTPSGLDVTTGDAFEPCVSATATMTLALPKRGLLSALQFVGELWLADVSIPRAAYERIGVHVPELFARDTLVQLDPDDVE